MSNAKAAFGTDTNAVKKRVKFRNDTGSSVTLRTGHTMVYQWDTTSNILGYDKGAGGHPESQSSPTTTADGYQNEGKFLEVSVPQTADFFAFAGVVTADYNGVVVANGSTKWIEIYVPNGAVVPVWSSANATGGSTKLYLANASSVATSTATTTGFIGIAWETVNRSGTNGLILVKLVDPQVTAVIDSIETIASDNAVAIASIETIASDNAVAIASIETIASDNAVAIASIETIASDNAVAIASVETIASDNVVAIQLIEDSLSDAVVAFKAAIGTVAVAKDSVSSLASDVEVLLSDLEKAISDFEVVLSDAGVV